MKPMTIILIGAFISIIGGVIGAIGTWKHNKASSEKSTRIEEGVKKGVSLGETTNSEVSHLRTQNLDLIKQAVTLNEKVEMQSKTIDKLREENTDLYTKLANSSLDIYNNLTGGDSYCSMTIGNLNSSKDVGSLIFMLGDKNKYPLKSVQVRIVDLNTFDFNTTLDDVLKGIINLEIIEPQKAVLTPFKYNLDKNKGVNLNVFYSASNGFFTQLIRMRFLNDTWSSATVIEREGKRLFKKIDDGYPEKNESKIFK